ncbi:MAG: Transglutaminase domain protein [Verrucomicrobiales bacterium]|nr:Transglutaminase domain protein [Verrucomicrobiales bacterium]
MGSAQFIQGRVIISPSGPWVKQRDLDFTFTPKVATDSTYLLLDHQHNATSHEYFQRSVFRLETLYAARHLAQWQLAFSPRTQEVILHSVSSIRGMERVEQLRMDRLRIIQREKRLEQMEISGEMTIMLVLEDIRVGDVIDFSYTIRQRPDFLQNRFSSLVELPVTLPVRAFHFDLTFCSNSPMRWKSNQSSFAPSEEDGGTQKRWSWMLEHCLPAEVERNVPSWHIANKWVQVSDCSSWAEVSQHVLAAWKEDFADPVLESVANDIVSRESGFSERAQAALQLVQDNVRYLSVNDKLGGHMPSAPGEVLKRKFGDCKDKSFLLAHLFRKLGISARPVLVHSQLRETITQFLPSAQVFDHAIVEYEIEGKRYWADGIIPLQGGSTPRRSRPDYKIGLPIGLGVTSLETIGSPQTEGCYDLKQTFIVDTSGKPSTLITRVTATGHEADRLRRRLAEEGQESVANQNEEFYRLFDSQLKRLSPMEWWDDRKTNSIQLADAFEVSGFDCDVQLSCGASLIRSALVLPQDGKKKRSQPLMIPFPLRWLQTIEIESPSLPQGFSKPVHIRTPAFKFSRQITHRVGHWSIAYSLETLVDSISGDQFEKYVASVQEVMDSLRIGISFPRGYASPRRGRNAGNLSKPKQIASETIASTDPSTVMALPAIAAALMSLPQNSAVPAEPIVQHTKNTVQPTGRSSTSDQPQTPVSPRIRKLPVRTPESTAAGEVRKSARRWLLAMTIALPMAIFVLYLTTPMPREGKLVATVFSVIWTGIPLFAIWKRQNWAKYVLAGFLALTCLWLTVGIIVMKDNLDVIGCFLALCIRAPAVGLLLFSSALRKFTSRN